MGKAEIQQAIGLLRKQEPTFGDIQNALNLVTASGVRNSDVEVALYFSKVGNNQQAKTQAGKAADELSKIIEGAFSTIRNI